MTRRLTLALFALASPALAQTLPTPNLGCNTKINSTTIGCPAAVAIGGTGAASLSGILKGNGTSPIATATPGTDYAPATSGTSILKGNGGGGTTAAVAGSDYVAPGAMGSAAGKNLGTSVADPGAGALETLLPVQTITGTGKTFGASDLYKETRRSNSGAAMTDTFPGTSTTGLANGTTIQLNNVDATASIALSAGSGTTLNGASSVAIPAGRSTKWVYDAPNTVWRSTMNSLSGVIGPSSATNGSIATFNGTSGVLIQDSGKSLPTGAIAGTTDTQTLTNKTIDTAGPNTIKIGGVALSAGQHPGTATNDNASAGNVGEYVSSSVGSGSAIALTSGTGANLTSLSLTAGDWDINCEIQFQSTASTAMAYIIASVSTTAATSDFGPGNFTQANMGGNVPGVTNSTANTPPVRKSIASATTFYCVGQGGFTVSTLTMWGMMRARRVR